MKHSAELLELVEAYFNQLFHGECWYALLKRGMRARLFLLFCFVDGRHNFNIRYHSMIRDFDLTTRRYMCLLETAFRRAQISCTNREQILCQHFVKYVSFTVMVSCLCGSVKCFLIFHYMLRYLLKILFLEYVFLHTITYSAS